MGKDSCWEVVNVVLWAVSWGYEEGHLVGTGECGGMGFMEGLWIGTVGAHW